MAISETGSIQAEKLAIDQINATGGVLGRKIKIIQEDGASDWPTFAEKAKKLLVNDKVAVGLRVLDVGLAQGGAAGVREGQRHALLPDVLRGLEQSKNVIYTGQEATQQIIAGLDWLQKEKKAKTFYLIGSDYIWPRTSNKIARKHIENVLKRKVVGEEYYPLGHTQFGSLINKIKLKKPDVIYAIIVGGSNVAVLQAAQGGGRHLDKQTLLTISVTEDEMLGIGGENMVGVLRLHEVFREPRQREQQEVRVGVQEEVGRQDRHRRRDPGGLSRPLAVEARRREGGQLRHRQGRGGVAGRRAQGRARRLRERSREPPPLEQAAHRPGAADGQYEVHLRDRRPDRAQPVPQGLPVSRSLRCPAHERRGAPSPIVHQRSEHDVRGLFAWPSWVRSWSCRASTG